MRQLGEDPVRPFRQCGDPRIPHRVGDRLRGVQHVAHERQPQDVGLAHGCALPAPSLRNAHRAGYAGGFEEPFDHQHQELLQDLLRAQQHGHLPVGRFRSRPDDRDDRQVLRRTETQSRTARMVLHARTGDDRSRREDSAGAGGRNDLLGLAHRWRFERGRRQRSSSCQFAAFERQVRPRRTSISSSSRKRWRVGAEGLQLADYSAMHGGHRLSQAGADARRGARHAAR